MLRKHRPLREELDKITGVAGRLSKAESMAKALFSEEQKMNGRFNGWKQFQNGIAHKFESIEFRRAGGISYNLFKRRFGTEKALDVYLATDLLLLRDIYDIAIIVSGDQDYVPAVQAAKDSGKHVVNVSFLERGGRLLPGGARRLNMTTDRTIQMEHAEVMKFMNVTSPPSATSSVTP